MGQLQLIGIIGGELYCARFLDRMVVLTGLILVTLSRHDSVTMLS